jgi:hypothetical protein
VIPIGPVTPWRSNPVGEVGQPNFAWFVTPKIVAHGTLDAGGHLLINVFLTLSLSNLAMSRFWIREPAIGAANYPRTCEPANDASPCV